MEPYGPHHHHHWRLPCMGCTSSYTPPCTPPCTPHCTPPCTLLVTPLPPTVHGLHTSLYCAIRPDCPGAMCQLRVCSCAPANERRMILGRKRSHGSELIFVNGAANICYLVVMVKMCPYNDSYEVCHGFTWCAHALSSLHVFRLSKNPMPRLSLGAMCHTYAA